MSKLPDINDLEPVNNFPDINDLEEIDPYEQAVRFSKKRNSFSPDDLKASMVGAVQSMTFNSGDELVQNIINTTDNLAKSENPFLKYVGNQLGGREQIVNEPSVKERVTELATNSPRSYLAGEVAGSLAVPVPPVASTYNIGTKIGLHALSGAVQGGLDAYGRNENPDDLLKDVAYGSAIGGVVGGAFPAIGEGAKVIKNKIAIPDATKEILHNTKNKALGVLFDIPEDNIDEILKNPQKVREALTLQDVADRLPESMSILNSKTKDLDNTAWRLLSKEKEFGIPQRRLADSINEIENSLMTETEQGLIPKGLAEDKAVKQLLDFKEKLFQYDDVLTEHQVKGLVRSLDDTIDWDKIDVSLKDKVLKSVRHNIDDILKNQNDEYRKAMVPVQELTDLGHSLRSNFRLEKANNDFGMNATDTTISKLSNVLSERKGFTQDKLKRYAHLTGHDILSETKYAKLADSLEATTTNGSRKTNMGAILGGSLGTGVGAIVGAPTLGGAIGAGLGGLVGYSADKYARKVGKQFLLNGNPQSYVSRFNGTPYFNTLNNAMKRGNKSLAVTHYLLSQTDPRFRQLDQDKDN